MVCDGVISLFSLADVTIGPLIDVTEEEQCGLVDTDGYDCELSTQPCFYNVTVIHVYKGDYQVSVPVYLKMERKTHLISLLFSACLPLEYLCVCVLI